MTDTPATLEGLFDKVPSDLEAYFDQISAGSFRNRYECGVNLLPIEEAARWTNDFRDFHPIVQFLRGVILDDPGTSKHHVYLSAPPCEGAVLFLNHDGETQIVFPSLAAFVEAARCSISESRDLTSFHPKNGTLIANQNGLHHFIADLYDGLHEVDSTDVLPALLPSSDLKSVDLLKRMANDDDFFIAEAVGEAIARRPRLDLESIAIICCNHSHAQASSAGKRAMAAIAALK